MCRVCLTSVEIGVKTLCMQGWALNSPDSCDKTIKTSKIMPSADGHAEIAQARVEACPWLEITQEIVVNLGKELGSGAYGSVIEAEVCFPAFQGGTVCGAMKVASSALAQTLLFEELHVYWQLRDVPGIPTVIAWYPTPDGLGAQAVLFERLHRSLFDECQARIAQRDAEDPTSEEPLFDDEDGWSIILSVVHTVAAAHSKGIYHCDLKPENIMFDNHGSVKVIDWGCALAGPRPGQPAPMTPRVWGHGTAGYRAPEMEAEATAAPVSERLDVHALAITAVVFLFGMSACEAQRLQATQELWELLEGDPALAKLVNWSMSDDAVMRATLADWRVGAEHRLRQLGLGGAAACSIASNYNQPPCGAAVTESLSPCALRGCALGKRLRAQVAQAAQGTLDPAAAHGGPLPGPPPPGLGPMAMQTADGAYEARSNPALLGAPPGLALMRGPAPVDGADKAHSNGASVGAPPGLALMRGPAPVDGADGARNNRASAGAPPGLEFMRGPAPVDGADEARINHASVGAPPGLALMRGPAPVDGADEAHSNGASVGAPPGLALMRGPAPVDGADGARNNRASAGAPPGLEFMRGPAPVDGADEARINHASVGAPPGLALMRGPAPVDGADEAHSNGASVGAPPGLALMRGPAPVDGADGARNNRASAGAPPGLEFMRGPAPVDGADEARSNRASVSAPPGLALMRGPAPVDGADEARNDHASVGAPPGLALMRGPAPVDGADGARNNRASAGAPPGLEFMCGPAPVDGADRARNNRASAGAPPGLEFMHAASADGSASTCSSERSAHTAPAPSPAAAATGKPDTAFDAADVDANTPGPWLSVIINTATPWTPPPVAAPGAFGYADKAAGATPLAGDCSCALSALVDTPAHWQASEKSATFATSPGMHCAAHAASQHGLEALRAELRQPASPSAVYAGGEAMVREPRPAERAQHGGRAVARGRRRGALSRIGRWLKAAVLWGCL
eukprot:jgi/Ulvmu1/12668/UM094_0024.1